jgi:hypothetical protein
MSEIPEAAIEAAARAIWATEYQTVWDALYAKNHRKDAARDKAAVTLTAALPHLEAAWEGKTYYDHEAAIRADERAKTLAEAKARVEAVEAQDQPIIHEDWNTGYEDGFGDAIGAALTAIDRIGGKDE